MYLTEERIRPLLRYETLIPAMRQMLMDYSAGLVEQPARMVMRVKDEAGVPTGYFALMPAIAGDVMGVKSVTFFPGNGALGVPTHLATIELKQRTTGEPLAVMDGRLITEMRTAAVSAVAVQALARPGAKTLGILGAGVQARAHIEALRVARPGLQGIRIWGRDAAKAAALASEMGAEAVGIEAAAGCDVVLTATSATEPVLMGQWLKPESLVVAVGAVGAHLRELDDETMRACLIAESRQGAEHESGDVILSGAKVHAEIGEILAGTRALPEAGRRVFKSVGMAIEDVTAARQVWEALQICS
jgi:ornithine cyclodeaminase/alanine dehydrogenase-like protein (mu-crystallin family)